MPDPSSVDVAMFQAAIDTAREPVFWVDADGRLVYANQRACAWLAYEREAIGCLRIWDLDVEMTLERWSTLWNQTVIDGLFETSYRRRDGRLFPSRSRPRGWRSAAGGCGAFVRDISERRVFTEALRRTQVAVDRARDPIFWVKCAGRSWANGCARPGPTYRSCSCRVARRARSRAPTCPPSRWASSRSRSP
jgi:PAS domain S-box-containing protein